jgi:hypothetical protein
MAPEVKNGNNFQEHEEPIIKKAPGKNILSGRG